MKKIFLEVSTGKHLHRSLFFSKVAGINPATLLKKTLRHRCFPVNFAKFLSVPFLPNTSGRRFLLKEPTCCSIYSAQIKCRHSC